MALTDALTGTSNFLGDAIGFLIFWKNWSTTSQYMLLAFVCFCFIGYKTLKSEMSNNTPRRKNR